MSDTNPTGQTIAYENNPFTVAANGLRLFFQLGLSVAIFTIILSVGSLATNVGRDYQTGMTSSNNNSSLRAIEDDTEKAQRAVQHAIDRHLPVIIAIGTLLLLVLISIMTLISSILDYTSAQISRNKTVTLSDAFATSLRNFFPYLWLRILVGVKTFLWTLLFIVPGIIMSVRYSLAGVSYYDKQLSAEAAIQDSSRLVKGAWLTTNGSFALFNYITFGLMQYVLHPGTSAILYRQLDDYDKAKLPKPPAHILSWLTLIIPYTLITLFILFVVIAFVLIIEGLS